jgi:acetyl esterase/lipase
LKNSPPIPPLDPDIDILKLRAAILARKRHQAGASTVSTAEVLYVEEDRQIPVRDGSSITVRIHKPKVLPKDGCPIFVVYHGGGFTLGDLDDEAILCRNFTQLGGIAVNVDYRLAPEHPFPVPIEDAFDALKWVCNRRFPPELG